MTREERLADLFGRLTSAGIRCLVMGGHAVRFHGVERTTIDYDFHLAGVDWDRLPRVLETALELGDRALREGRSWRPVDFRRFVIGRLPDGRDESLECWRRNHLLAPFEELFARRADGIYGGTTVSFLGLSDLVRSKETEREDDWRDVELLEEIGDERRILDASLPEGKVAFLADLRSRRGFERAVAEGILGDTASVEKAWPLAKSSVTLAYLAPFIGEDSPPLPFDIAPRISEVIEVLVGNVEPSSARHLALAEAVRRLRKREAMEADREDKLRAWDRGSSDPRTV